MKKILYFLSVSLLTVLVACNKVDVAPEVAKDNGSKINTYDAPTSVCGQQTSAFIAGKNIGVGEITVANTATEVFVTYTTTSGWVLGKTHLYVGTLAGLPTNNANTPVPGQFPYKVTHNGYATSYTYTIPASSLPSCYIVAAHAEVLKLNSNGSVQKSETAWGYGTAFPNTNRWGWYISYCNTTCGGDGGDDDDDDDEGQTGLNPIKE